MLLNKKRNLGLHVLEQTKPEYYADLAEAIQFL